MSSSGRICILCKMHKGNLTSAYKAVHFCGERKNLSEVIQEIKNVEITEAENPNAEICGDCDKSVLESWKVKVCIRINRFNESRYMRLLTESNCTHISPVNKSVVDLENPYKATLNLNDKEQLIETIKNLEEQVQKKEKEVEAEAWKYFGEIFEEQRKSKIQKTQQPSEVNLAPIFDISQKNTGKKMIEPNGPSIEMINTENNYDSFVQSLSNFKSYKIAGRSASSDTLTDSINLIILNPSVTEKNTNSPTVSNVTTKSKSSTKNARKYRTNTNIHSQKKMSEKAIANLPMVNKVSMKVDLATCITEFNSTKFNKSTHEHNANINIDSFKKLYETVGPKNLGNTLMINKKDIKIQLDTIHKHNSLNCCGEYNYQEKLKQDLDQNIERMPSFKLSKAFTLRMKIFDINNGFKINQSTTMNKNPAAEMVEMLGSNYTNAFTNYYINKGKLMVNIELETK